MDIMAPSSSMAMDDAAGGWRADGTNPTNDHARRERATAMIPTGPSYQTETGMSIIPGETGENFMNDDEKELEKILRILRMMNREQLHLLYLVSLEML